MRLRSRSLLALSVVCGGLVLVGLVVLARVRDRRADGILAHARADRAARRFGEAEIQYRRALQIDGRDPAVHEEMASLYEEWLGSAPTEKAARLRVARHESLSSAARFGTTSIRPRLSLLHEALERDDRAEAHRWATELLRLDSDDPAAHGVVAEVMLEESAPNFSEVARHLAHVEAMRPRPARAAWLAARVAQARRDEPGLRRVLIESRRIPESASLPAVDAISLFRLRVLDIRTIDDPPTLADRARALTRASEALTAGADIPPGRAASIGRAMEGVHHALSKKARNGGAASSSGPGGDAIGASMEDASDALFRKAISVPGGADLGVYLSYADHYRSRGLRSRCLEVIEDAFRTPVARQGVTDALLSLHALAVHAILTDVEDGDRYARADPHIKALLGCSTPRFRAFGHMYQGQIDLERLGLVGGNDTEAATADRSKARASAVGHLKAAADDLPDLADAQARYGVALILGREAELGRVYLQKAATLGPLDPGHQAWAAWAMVHGGYPEDAEPIVRRLLVEVEAGRLPGALGRILHLVDAEVHRARGGPDELNQAILCYQRAFTGGEKPTAAVQLRLAQIENALNRRDDALARIDAMDRAGQGGPGAESIAVDILRGTRGPGAARERLARARARYPRSVELVAIEAETLVSDGQAGRAERLIADFLAGGSADVALVELRSWILSTSLGRDDEARALLAEVAERSDRSSPWIRLAQLDIARRDFSGAEATVAKLRARWKESAVADILDAQIAIGRGNTRLATTCYEAALKKDPKNKRIQFWKAQLDGLIDPQAAAGVLEALASESSTQEVAKGLSLDTAARSALADLRLKAGDIDDAIGKYRDLIRVTSPAEFSKDVRWKLVAAQVEKKRWPAARAELEAILGDSASPPSVEERVAAAMYYKEHGEGAVAERLVDATLNANPSHPWAVGVRAQWLTDSGRPGEAKVLLRRAITACPDRSRVPAVFYLLLAAIENGMPPVSDGLARALKVVEEGLQSQPKTFDLVRAKCRLLGLMGDSKAAIAHVQRLSADEPRGPFPPLLIALLGDAREYDAAEKAASARLEAVPSDAETAATLVRLLVDRASEAARRGDRARVGQLDSRVANLIRDYRTRLPDDLDFIHLDFERAIRRGEPARALALAQEVDRILPGRSAGAILRAQVYSTTGRAREVAAAYAEAVEKDPRRSEVRLSLARSELAIGETDRAIRQARLIPAADPERPAAVLVEAKALASRGGTPAAAAADRAAAGRLLAGEIKARPGNSGAYHLLAEVLDADGKRDRAVETLVAGLEAVPSDAAGLSIAVRLLCEPAAPGLAADPARLARARSLADRFAAGDRSGTMSHAAAVGFQRSGQLDLALPWAEQAARLSGPTTFHFDLGDLLISLAEASRGTERTSLFLRAVAQFDRVLSVDPANVEAANNKAWVLNTHLDRSREALEVAEELIRRVEPSVLPADFHDTLGSIQESLGRPREAEESYRVGLAKSPDLPVLNFRLARLIAADASRSRQASAYLAKARAGRPQLSREMAAEAAALAERVDR